VYDYGLAGPESVPFLVMELVDGPSLADVMARGPLDPSWAPPGHQHHRQDNGGGGNGD